MVLDAATLTGHSSFTGKTHAAAMASDGALEELAIAAGLSSGEHVVPMVFLPEAQVTHHEPVLLSELWNNAEKAR
jgi:leucyl aminopeptidase